MLHFWMCVYVWFGILANSIYSVPNRSRNGVDTPSIVEFESERCNDMDIYKWAGDFHECYIDRKYNDSGKDLNNIVYRISEHTETCVTNSRRNCQPDFEGFLRILNKVIEQMKDYSSMYLEFIHKGRENIKDLYCIERKLSLQSYKTCFKALSIHPALTRNDRENVTRDGLLCANKANRGCSKKTRTTLNRIVQTILGVEQPKEEDIGDEITATRASIRQNRRLDSESFAFSSTPAPPRPSTTTPAPPRPSTTTPAPPRPSTTTPAPPRPTRRTRPTPPPPEPTEAPWRWYDYIIQPFISAWNAVRNFFG